MAEIPGVPLPEVESRPLPSPGLMAPAGEAAFGAILGRDLEHMAAALDKVQAEADATRAMEAETSFAQGISQALHGHADPMTGEGVPGFLELKGHEALSQSADITRSFVKRRSDLAAGLQNDRQRQFFLQRTQGDLIGAQRVMEAHVGQQIQYLQNEALRSRLDTAIDAAGKVANVRDELGAPVGIQAAEEQINAMEPWLRAAAEKQMGLRGDAAQRFVKTGQGMVALAAIDRLIESPGRWQDATRMFERWRDALTEKQIGGLRLQLRAAELRDESTRMADEIYMASEGDPKEIEASVRSIPQPDIRDAVEKRIGERLTRDRIVEAATDEPRIGRLDVAIYQGRGLDRNSTDYAGLSDKGKAAVEARFYAWQRQGSAEQNRTDEEALYAFRTLNLRNPVEGTDQVSIDVEHSPLFDSVSPKGRQRLRFEQKNARKLWEKDNGMGYDAFMAKARVIADGMGWTGSEKPGATTDRATFLRHMTDAYKTWVEANPERTNVPPEEAKALFLDAVRYGDMGGMHLSRNRYFFKVAPEDRPKFSTKDFESQQEGQALVEQEFKLIPGASRPRGQTGPRPRTMAPAHSTTPVAPAGVPDEPPVPGAVRSKSGRWIVKDQSGAWVYWEGGK